MSIPQGQTETVANPILQSRALLGRIIENGIDPPDHLLLDVLLAGKVHDIYGQSGAGKTMLTVCLVKDAVGRGFTVLFCDAENGPRTIADRLCDLGVDPQETDERLVYVPSPSLTL